MLVSVTLFYIFLFDITWRCGWAGNSGVIRQELGIVVLERKNTSPSYVIVLTLFSQFHKYKLLIHFFHRTASAVRTLVFPGIDTSFTR